YDDEACVKAVYPLLRCGFAIRPRAVFALARNRETHRPLARLAVVVLAGQVINAGQQLSREQVDVVDLRAVARRVAEAVRVRGAGAVEPVEQKAATALGDSQGFGAAAQLVPVKEGVRGKDRADGVRRAAWRKEGARLPIEIVSPTRLFVIMATHIQHLQQQRANVVSEAVARVAQPRR